MNILIIGHARHGKDTLAEVLNLRFGLTFKSSSMAAAEIFIYDILKETYGYSSPEKCFEDRVNHRKEWFDLITDFNLVDKTALATEILSYNNMYVGMRDSAEIEACNKKGMFDFVVGVYNPNLPLEGKDSFNIDLWNSSSFVIPNSGTLEEFEKKILDVFEPLLKKSSLDLSVAISNVDKWKSVCNTVVQDFLTGGIHVDDTVERLSSKFDLK